MNKVSTLLFAGAIGTFFAATPVMAQSWQDIHNDRANMRNDTAQIHQDRRDMRQDLRDRDYAAARDEHREMVDRADQRKDLRHDIRQDVHHDIRQDVRHDVRQDVRHDIRHDIRAHHDHDRG